MRGRSAIGASGLAILLFGFAFLYAPIGLLAIYSFNASKLVAVWGGFSTKWYWSLLDNRALLDSLWVSLRVAFASASIATVLGALAAMVLARHGRFRGRALFSAMIYAPLVMPEIVLGIALLLLFVALGLERGVFSIVVAHATLGMCFVAVLVHARIKMLDRSLEEAAQDLGAGPAAIFFTITLPLIAPALLAGFLLAFTISLDDFVLASFLSGPGSTTLPMRIYAQVRLGVTPEVNAVSTLLLAFVGVILLGGAWIARRMRAS